MGNRPLMQAMASQQKALQAAQQKNAALEHQLAVQALQLTYIARLAGVTRELDAIRRQADIENPAQPVPNPGSQPATESTEQAATPAAYDDPNAIGQTPGATEGVPAAATATPMDPGESLPTAPFNNLTDVSAPVSGTETQIPLNQTRIETDVRVGDPTNPETAFPLNPAFGPSAQRGTTPPRSGEMSQTSRRKTAAEYPHPGPEPEMGEPNSKERANWALWDQQNDEHQDWQRDKADRQAKQSSQRTVASIRLARLRVAAGLAQGDDLAVAAKIEQDRKVSDAMIRHEIATLSQVVKAASKQQRPAGLVPRSASGVQRTMPSLVTQPAPITSVAGAVGAYDDDAESLFD